VAETSEQTRRIRLMAACRALVHAIQHEDEAVLERLLSVGRSRRMFAPIAFAIGALALLLEGLKVLIGNWRLMLIQILPALLIWIAMLDLRLHALHGRSFHVVRGAILIPIFLAIIAVTIGSFFLNAVFAFAISGPRPPVIRPAVAEARGHIVPIAVSGTILGALLAVATTISSRWSHPWFTVTLGVVVGMMMIIYVALPARLIGVTPAQPRRDKLTASALSGALGAVVSTPPYLLGRVGILMLGTHYLLIPGIFVLALGLTLQAGATGAVRAIKMSTRLAAGASPPSREAGT
jgi:hypothetical protein